MRRCHRFASSNRFVPSLLLVAGLLVWRLSPAVWSAEPVPAAATVLTMEQAQQLFDNSVRGLLIKQCGECHTGESVEGEFDLGTREALLKGGAAGSAILPGNADGSLLMQLVRHQKKPHMPQDAPALSETQVADLARWINAGAPYTKPLVDPATAVPAWTQKQIPAEAKQHWAFQRLQTVEPPATEIPGWSTGAIDRFLAARLTAAGITPNPPADRRVFIRRVSLDLIGLPPEPKEVAEFLSDPDPKAEEKLVDRLLSRPQYGERWARFWLDLARFAESHGYEHDYDRPTAYHYRDFVIQAFNQDLPFDTFVKWQLAGDEYAPDNRLALMATGYLAAGVHSTQITKNEVEKHRYDELDDILATTGTAMLGLTVGCARCHDHKFDTIPQRDYYRLLSAFTTTVRSEVELDFDPEGYAQQKQAYDAAHQPFVDALAAFERDQLPKNFAAWEAERAKKAPQPSDLPASTENGWLILSPTKAEAKGAQFERLGDGSLLAVGPKIDHDKYTFQCETTLVDLKTLRLELLPDPSLVKNGPGRAENGNFALSVLTVTAAPKNEPAAAKPVSLKNARATFEQKGLPVAAAIDGDANSAWAVDPEFGKPHAAAFDFEQPVGFPAGTVLTIEMQFNNNVRHSIGRPRISVTRAAAAPALLAEAWPAGVLEALTTAADKRTPEQVRLLLDWYRLQDADWQKLNRAAAEHAQTAPKRKLEKVLISSEGLPAVRLHTQGQDFLDQTHFLRRGDVALKDGIASTGYLQLLVNAPSESVWTQTPPAGWRTSYRRKALAKWITDPERGAGGLLARVIVNRLWQKHFGQGLVRTASDFGVKGDTPSHPELLDWLASDLIRQGWKLKPLHRQIVLSAAYRQSSLVDPKKLAVDPDNRLIWRRPRRRLDAEAIRDSLLSVSGLLDTRMYGPGTLDNNQRRRGIYFTVKRSQLVPMLQIFDCPDALQGVPDRPATTVAPQALFLLNGPLVREAAGGLSRRAAELAGMGVSGTDLSPRIQAAYELTLGRAATSQELQEAKEFLAQQAASYQSLTPAEQQQAAWRDFCQVLLCLNEFVYVE